MMNSYCMKHITIIKEIIQKYLCPWLKRHSIQWNTFKRPGFVCCFRRTVLLLVCESISTVMGLAQAVDKPVVSVPTLDALPECSVLEWSDLSSNGRQTEQVYTSLYRRKEKECTRLMPYLPCRLSGWQSNWLTITNLFSLWETDCSISKLEEIP